MKSTGNPPAATVTDTEQGGLLAGLERFERRLARLETVAIGIVTAAVFLILLSNVFSRSVGRPLIWSDELAINLMIWAAFIGASLGLARRQHIAVTLLPDALAPGGRHVLAILVDLVLLSFFAILAVLVWNWLDLPGLIAAGSADALAQSRFNFTWQEPMMTLSVRKVWFWLILPIFCLTGTFHVAMSLMRHIRDSSTTEVTV
ncbi:TRAP transporter small permease [Paracoccus pacificus]|uniref:TRAP transporter small permease protein n=1 Tax=Paracoccus pacificus TaxID=1463598 RepID=A0ABW4R4E5_9RHOB